MEDEKNEKKEKRHEHIAVHPSTFEEFRKVKDEYTDDRMVRKLVHYYSIWKQKSNAKMKAKEDKEDHDRYGDITE